MSADGESGVEITEGAPYVIGIGASAGGLEAIRELVSHLPKTGDAAYVVVQHLSPKYKSILATLIERETALTVQDIEDNMPIERNRVYVAPPNHDVIFREQRFHLTTLQPGALGPKPSIDLFFSSLAEEGGERAVGIILSGTGSDGAYGMRAIRGAGGITIAQEPQTSKYDGMPIAAIETDCVDLILPPADIGDRLGRILTSKRSDLSKFSNIEQTETAPAGLLQILLAATRVDFRQYKPNTVQRRIERRQSALGISDIQEYTQYCRNNPDEIQALFKDLMISVTAFFRDPADFELLADEIQSLVARGEGRTLRVWVAGCATGEEVYTIAMLFGEAFGGPEYLKKRTLQIFATDIDRSALVVARRGGYPFSAVAHLSPDLVSRYFTRYEDGVRVCPQLHDVVLFSEHNVFQDPPFSNLDLVSCRNLLIYFNNALQKRVLSRLHYGLRKSGALFLGKAETVSAAEDLFWRKRPGAQLYAKRALAGSYEKNRSLQALSMRNPTAPETDRVERDVEAAADRSLFEALVRSFDAPALLITPEYRLVKVFGDLSDIIRLNEATRLDVGLDILKDPLAQEARALISLAFRHGVKKIGSIQRPDGARAAVQLEARPLSATGDGEQLALLLLHRVAHRDADPLTAGASEDVADTVRELQNELSLVREAHQQAMEELETSNEELQALNEQMQSSNEELQATNEELETSNEELQSTNEELITVNEELQINSAELTEINHEFDALMGRIDLAVVFVDSALHITRASAAAVAMFQIHNLTNRPHLTQSLSPAGFPNLAELCAEAMDSGETVTRLVYGAESASAVSCSPSADIRGRPIGAMIVVSQVPEAAELAQELRKLFDDAPVFMMRRAADGAVLRLSGAAAQLLGVSRADAEGAALRDLVDDDVADAITELDRTLLAERSQTRTDVELIRSRSGAQTSLLTTKRFLFRNAAGADDIYAISVETSETVRRNVFIQELLEKIQVPHAASLAEVQPLLNTGRRYLEMAAGVLIRLDAGRPMPRLIVGETPDALRLNEPLEDPSGVLERLLAAEDLLTLGPGDPRDRATLAGAPVARMIGAPLRAGPRSEGALLFVDWSGDAPGSFTSDQISFVRLVVRWSQFKLSKILDESQD